jgi:hypothetical protein
VKSKDWPFGNSVFYCSIVWAFCNICFNWEKVKKEVTNILLYILINPGFKIRWSEHSVTSLQKMLTFKWEGTHKNLQNHQNKYPWKLKYLDNELNWKDCADFCISLCLIRKLVFSILLTKEFALFMVFLSFSSRPLTHSSPIVLKYYCKLQHSFPLSQAVTNCNYSGSVIQQCDWTGVITELVNPIF